MSQNVVNYGIDPSGAQLLDELLSGEQQNRLTMDGGNSRPPYAEIGTIWTDKSVTGKATLKRFNGTSDDVMMTIDETTGAITIPGVADADLSNLSASGNSKFQAPLESGTNIKTVNNESLLGSGNITISAGADVDLSNLSATGNDKFVTKNTAQTITGVKTFSGTSVPEIDFKNSSAVPASGQYNTGRLNFLDADNKREALIQVVRNIDYNSTSLQLQVYNPNGQVSLLTIYKYNDGTYWFYCPSPASATSNRDEIATTKWCQENIGVVDYSAGTDVTSSVFATSGTGYKPAYKGVLMIKTYNSTAIAYLSVYNASGTLLFKKEINSAPYPNTSGGLVVLPVSQSYSYRVEPLAAGDSYALFCPYRSH